MDVPAYLVAIAAVISAGAALIGVRNQAKAAAGQIKAATDAAALQSRASVVSASRQRWIDAVREDVSEFLTVDAEHKAFDRWPSMDPDKNLASLREGDRLLARQMLLLKRIRLRLNPEEDEHVALVEKLQGLVAKAQEESGEAAEEIVRLTQAMLRTEWARVKREASGDVEVSTPSVS